LVGWRQSEDNNAVCFVFEVRFERVVLLARLGNFAVQNAHVELSDVAYEIHYHDEPNRARDYEITASLELQLIQVVV
jgi:hypothetical protein